ncbi:MAG: dGTP triphosphohydrolase [Cyanophyceae cyanobacterium]
MHSPSFRRLQGKTQLFPGFENEFFRNRLTHSLEVAQIAKSIALRFNKEIGENNEIKIDLDLVEFAGLAHDLGHPPFGHNGEHVLDEKMKEYGGFEGNAQTLRILARLEKKRLYNDVPPQAKDVGVSPDGKDYRAGLNLTARTLASVLKYDHMIPSERPSGDGLAKGYYNSESALVKWLKSKVLGPQPDLDESVPFKTIECQIMDLADDIAYSTYDLEDSLKAKFLTPLEILSLGESFRSKVATEVSKAIKYKFTADDVLEELIKIFGEVVKESSDSIVELTKVVDAYQRSEEIATSGYARIDLTSQLVGDFISGVEFEYNDELPVLSKASLNKETLRQVETLKRLTYNAMILSPRLSVAEYRGSEIVGAIFEALTEPKGRYLLPNDVQLLFDRFDGSQNKKMRVICDFIACMTDSYAIEFYARLKSENARTIFKPL